MQFGIPRIKLCDHCGGCFEQPIIMSGNTLGAKLWTDGKLEAPMLPNFPEFVKCPHCRTLLWVEEQQDVEQTSFLQKFKRSKNYQRYQWPVLNDYRATLDRGEFSQVKERYLRIRLWWKENDRRRGKAEVLPLSELETLNLQALETLLDIENSSDRIMAAEIKRELKQFESAERPLINLLDGKFENAATVIASLAIEKDPFLEKLRWNEFWNLPRRLD